MTSKITPPGLEKPRLDIELWKHAQDAPLSELLMAWTVINARILDELQNV